MFDFQNFRRRNSGNSTVRSVFDFILNLVIVVLLAVGVKEYIFAFFWVSGESMIPTLQNEDLIMVSKASYIWRGADRGDIVVVIPPDNPNQYYVKRVIGLPKEEIIFFDGDFQIKSDKSKWKINESYLSEDNQGHTCPKPFSSNGNCNPQLMKNPVKVKIPENKYFIMGDNRTASSDSRVWADEFTHESGAIDREALVGRAVMRIWMEDGWPRFEILPNDWYDGLDK